MESIDLGVEDLFSEPEDEPVSGALVEGEEQPDTAQRDGATADQDGKKTEPLKKHVIRNPQPKLNADRICGARGISSLENFFSGVTFKGKGHEVDDLTHMLNKLEHWAHRLYPKMQFDDCLAKIEKLGTKNQVKTHLKKIRLGLDTPTNTIVDEVERESPREERQEETEFDLLLRDQENIMTDAPSSPILAHSVASHGLTAEQKERIRVNRLRAEEKRLALLSSQHQCQEESENGTKNTRVTSPEEERQVDTKNTDAGETSDSSRLGGIAGCEIKIAIQDDYSNKTDKVKSMNEVYPNQRESSDKEEIIIRSCDTELEDLNAVVQDTVMDLAQETDYVM